MSVGKLLDIRYPEYIFTTAGVNKYATSRCPEARVDDTFIGRPDQQNDVYTSPAMFFTMQRPRVWVDAVDPRREVKHCLVLVSDCYDVKL